MVRFPQLPSVVRFNRGLGLLSLIPLLMGLGFFGFATLAHLGDPKVWMFLTLLLIWPIIMLTIRLFQGRKVVLDFNRGVVLTRGSEHPFAYITSALVWSRSRSGSWLILFSGTKQIARLHLEGGLCRNATDTDWLAMRHLLAVKIDMHSRVPLAPYEMPNRGIWWTRSEQKTPIEVLHALDRQLTWMASGESAGSVKAPFRAVMNRFIRF